MRKRLAMTVLPVVVLMVQPMTPAHAGFVTGEELHAVCSDLAVDDRCQMYVAGVADALLGLRESGALQTTDFCLMVGIDTAQVADVVERYLSSNPEQRKLPTVTLILDALRDAFPCQ
jgi:hypothetical protein